MYAMNVFNIIWKVFSFIFLPQHVSFFHPLANAKLRVWEYIVVRTSPYPIHGAVQ